ncbi:DUF6049 family protein [Saccharopolyspora rosea]
MLAAVVAALFAVVVPPMPGAHAQEGDKFARLDVTKITPSVVTGGSPGELVVAGRLTNTGDRAISDVEVRIQRGNPVTDEPATQRAMRGDVPTVTEPAFSPVVDRLAPGQQVPVEFHIPFTGPNSLQISQPGIFPLLVNINGVPRSGSRARIAEGRFLLPVSAPPGGAPARPSQPTPTSMVVPIVDYPRLVQDAGAGSRPVLSDDQLSGSLAPGGRLYGLVQAVSDSAPSGSPLGSALCFAIDPDLLATVKAMRGGYLVRQPNGSTVEGIGAKAADLWLSKLRDATSGRCVIALPYADADVAALGRAGLPDLIKGAMDGSQLVNELLHVEPRQTAWPIEGALDEPAAGELPGVTSALLEPQSLSTPPGSLSPVRVRGHDLAAIPIDPLLTSALDPQHDTATKVTALSPPDNGSLSAQDALGALAFRASQGSLPNSTSVLVPPRRWNMRADDLRSLLSGMQQLDAEGYIKPTALPNPDPSALPQADLTYPVGASADEIPQPVLNSIARQNFKVGDLFRSAEKERSVGVDPAEVTTPLRNGLLRAASSAWRSNPDAAHRWLRKAVSTLDGTLGKVRIEEYAGNIVLAQSNSPIPLTVVNDLPIKVRMMLHVPRTPGVQIKDLGVLKIPPHSKRQFWLDTTTHRPGKFNIDITATTEAGTVLGPTKRLQVESSTYGSLIPALTVGAGALLVVLSGIRIVRRARNRRRRIASGEAVEPDENARIDTSETAGISTTDGDRNPD